MDYFNQLINALENRQETDAILIVKEHGKEFSKYQDFNGNTILTYAIKNKLPFFANSMLRDELLINMPDCYGNAPLHLSINRGNEDLAIQLVKFGAEKDVANNSGVTPLFLALNAGMLNLVEEMMNDSKTINLTNNDGNNALLVCIDKYSETKDKKYVELAKKLIEKDINLNYYNNNKDSIYYKENALTFAIKKESIEIAKEIIKTGKGLNIADKDDNRPITLCIEKGYENLGVAILSYDIEMGYTINGDTALTLAIKKEAYGIADTIVSKKQLISDCDKDRNYPISLAIERGLKKLTSKLIDIKYINDGIAHIANSTDFPLTLAIKSAQVEIAEELVFKCKDVAVNVYDKYGMSAFGLALDKGLDNLCISMIKNGLKINDYANEAETYLTMAIKKMRPEVVKTLVNAGVKIVPNKLGETPQNICIKYQTSSILSIIDRNAYNMLNQNKKPKNYNEETKKANPVIHTNVNSNTSPFMSEKERQSQELHKKIKSML